MRLVEYDWREPLKEKAPAPPPLEIPVEEPKLAEKPKRSRKKKDA